MDDTAATPQRTLDVNAATRGLLLRMGHSWFEQNELRQAISVYLKLIDEYPDSQESHAAQTKLMRIATMYEQEGLLRLSLEVLERLEETMRDATAH